MYRIHLTDTESQHQNFKPLRSGGSRCHYSNGAKRERPAKDIMELRTAGPLQKPVLPIGHMYLDPCKWSLEGISRPEMKI